MCFIPIVSLSTFIVEFIIATFILAYFKKSSLRNSTAILIYFLGLYQLAEYFLCTTTIPFMWGKIAFIAYSFLPAIGLKITFDYLKKKSNIFILFIIPFLFTLLALFKENFVTGATCEKFLVVIVTVFSDNFNTLFKLIYGFYYFGFILLIFYLLYKQNKKNKKITFWLNSTFLVGLFPAIVFLFIFPSIYYKFPSVYCHFSILTSFCLIRVMYLVTSENQKEDDKQSILK
jgi:hypothetical protein